MIYKFLILTLVCAFSVACSSIRDKFGDDDKPTTAQEEEAGAREANFPKANQRAKLNKPLALPPDLVGSSNAKVQTNAEPFSETRVLPEVVGARINKQDDKTWLEIDTNVESAWKTISEYWVTNGVSLVDYNPEAGTMETEWIKKKIALDEEGSVVKQLFKSLLQATINRNTSLDKYRLRFERVSPNKTAMFVSHRATARKAIESARKITEFEWVELPSSPERIADFLQNIILIFDQSASD